jgi:CheY-like chemotaxis protein
VKPGTDELVGWQGELGGGASLPAILVVDDDEDMRRYLGRCLRPMASRVVEARNGAEALELVREAGPGAFDLIVADVVMPGMDGLSLRKALAADPALGAPAVLLITGENPGPGAEPLLRKPFNARTLRRRVGDLLAGARGASEES